MDAPDKIYLHIHDDEWTSWSPDRINDKDVEYVRVPDQCPSCKMLNGIHDIACEKTSHGISLGDTGAPTYAVKSLSTGEYIKFVRTNEECE